MVALINKLPILHHKSTQKPKLDHFQSFQSTLSHNLHKLFSDHHHHHHHDSSPVSSLSLSWYIPCFTFIKEINRAFEKFIKDLDYPVTQWKGNNKKLVEDYFTYTLNILDSLNSISSSISHLGFQRLTLSHGVNSITTSSETRHLKPIILKELKKFDWKEISKEGRFEHGGKERVVHEAMMKMSKVEKLILKVLFCGLSGGEIGSSAVVDLGEFDGFDLGFAESTTMVMIKEIEEVNRGIEEEVEVEELKRKLGEIERVIESVGKEVNGLFHEVLAKRNELLNCFRLPKSTP